VPAAIVGLRPGGDNDATAADDHSGAFRGPVARAGHLSEPALSLRVDDEWSFIETLAIACA
jgi:hypothetical protein